VPTHANIYFDVQFKSQHQSSRVKFGKPKAIFLSSSLSFEFLYLLILCVGAIVAPDHTHWQTHTHTPTNKPQSVELLWTRNRPVAETSTWQHTTIIRHRNSCSRWDVFKRRILYYSNIQKSIHQQHIALIKCSENFIPLNENSWVTYWYKLMSRIYNKKNTEVEPAILASEQPQTHALDHAATEIGSKAMCE